MEQILKYVWLANTIYKAGKKGITREEINEKWKNHTDLSRGEELVRHTFSRWKRSTEDVFNILIECDRKNGYRYYISNVEELKSGNLSRWLLDTYSTANSITNRMSLRDRILVDNVPSSYIHLEKIFEAMQNNRVLTITYCGFEKEKAFTFDVDPFCVKLFRLRWYLLARNRYFNDEIRIYSLDRIEQLEISKKSFQLPEDFDANDYFSDYFGIVTDESVPVQRIVLRAYENHKHYLRTLPLHHSQRELCDEGDYADFELTLRPTYDFIMELLSKGSMLEVLEPQSLRKEMKIWVDSMWNYYRKEK